MYSESSFTMFSHWFFFLPYLQHTLGNSNQVSLQKLYNPLNFVLCIGSSSSSSSVYSSLSFSSSSCSSSVSCSSSSSVSSSSSSVSSSSSSWKYSLYVINLMIYFTSLSVMKFVKIFKKLSCKYMGIWQSISLNLIKIYSFVRNFSCIEEYGTKL